MNEDRKRILAMLAEGKITADEAEMLLDALGTPAADAAAGPGAASAGTTSPGATSSGAAAATASPGTARPTLPKYLYVRVTGDDRVDVKVPLGLLKAGLKLTSVIPPQAMDQINESMSQSGMSIDLDNLKPEDIEEIVNELREMEVTVEDKNGNHVRVWCA